MINLTQNSLTLNKTLPEFRDSFFIEGDVIIPDVKPDVDTVIYIDAVPVIDNYVVNSGQITLTGTSEFNILYVSEILPNEIIRISTSIPFKNSFAVANLNPESLINVILSPSKVSSLILNGRKLSVSTELCANIKISTKEEIYYIEEVENTETIQQLKSEKCIPVFMNQCTTKTNIRDTAMLTTDQPTIKDILKYDCSVEEEESVISDGKIILKAELHVKIYYTSEKSDEIHLFNVTLPISAFLDVKDIKENDNTKLTNTIKNLSIKLLPDSDDLMRIVEFDADVETSAKVFKNNNLEIIEDIYSTELDLLPEKENIGYELNTPTTTEDIMLRGTISIPEDENIKILKSLARVKSINLEKENNNEMLTGIIDVTIIYKVPSTGKINSVSLDMPMGHMLTEKIHTIENYKIKNIEVTSVGNEKYEVKITLEIKGHENKTDTICILKNLIETEKTVQKNTGLTIYFVKPDDTLWKIAKRFHTTIDHISEINTLENPDNLAVGQALIM